MSPRGRVASAVTTITAVALTVVACAVTRLDIVLVVGGTVLDPSGVAALLWSAAVLLALAVLAAALPRGRNRSRPLRPGTVAVVGGVLVGDLIGTGIWIAGAFVLSGAASIGPAATTILRPPTGVACTVVIRENSFLRTSSGRLFPVAAMGVAVPDDAWTLNEVQLPVRDGAYSVAWTRTGGTLRLRTDPPASYRDIGFSCPR